MNIQQSGNVPHIERVWATRPETEGILEDIHRKIQELDPSDAYHEGESIDAVSYYRALDRALGIVNEELVDWRSRR